MNSLQSRWHQGYRGTAVSLITGPRPSSCTDTGAVVAIKFVVWQTTELGVEFAVVKGGAGVVADAVAGWGGCVGAGGGDDWGCKRP